MHQQVLEFRAGLQPTERQRREGATTQRLRREFVGQLRDDDLQVLGGAQLAHGVLARGRRSASGEGVEFGARGRGAFRVARGDARDGEEPRRQRGEGRGVVRVALEHVVELGEGLGVEALFDHPVREARAFVGLRVLAVRLREALGFAQHVALVARALDGALGQRGPAGATADFPAAVNEARLRAQAAARGEVQDAAPFTREVFIDVVGVSFDGVRFLGRLRGALGAGEGGEGTDAERGKEQEGEALGSSHGRSSRGGRRRTEVRGILDQGRSRANRDGPPG